VARAEKLIVPLVIAAAAAILSCRPVYEPDLGWHLAQGRENFAGRLVSTNLFSFTYPDYRQHYTSWLSEAIAYGAWRAAGDVGVQIVQGATLAAAFAFVYLACRVRGTALASTAVLVLGFLTVEPRAIPRPHLVSFAGVAICAWLIERARAAGSARPLYASVPVVAAWSNAHGESIFGPAAIGLFAIAELMRPAALTRREATRALAVASCGGVALLANPYGWGMLQYLFENAMLPQMLTISELQPAYLPMYRAFFVYAAVSFVVLGSLPRQLTLWEVLGTIVFSALGYRYLRFTPLVFLATAPVLAARLSAWSARGVDGRAMLVTALVGAVFVSRLPLAAYVVPLRVGDLFPSSIFSARAIAFVRAEGLEGPVFNSNNLGGWIEWAMYPNVRAFQDSRLQAYPPEHFEAILTASRSQADWDALVRAVDWAVISTPRPNALSGAGRFPKEEWAPIFWDDAIEIRARRRGRYEAVVARLEYGIVTPESDIFTLAPMLSSPQGDRLRAEATRQRSENPDGFTGAAVACVTGVRGACDDVERLVARSPALEHEAALVRVLRSGK
jgi:hypothetical protein